MGDEPWIVQTQNTLGAVIKNPKLTGKLLVKPPFRFIHDCVTSFMSTTGMLDGLFEGDELDGKKVTEKDAKVQFLQKLITTMNIALGTEVDCRPTKVISGSEAENTNLMLQALAQLAAVPKDRVAAAVDQAVGRAPAAAAQQAPPPPRQQEKPQQEKPAAKPKPGSPAQQDPPPRSRGDESNSKPPSALQQSIQAQQQQQQAQQQNEGTTSAPARPSTARKPPPAVPSNETAQERVDIKETTPAQGVIVEKKADDQAGEEQDWMKLVEKQQEQEQQRQAQQAANDGDGAGFLAKQALQAKQEQEEAARRAREQAEAQGQRSEGIVLNTRKKREGEVSGAMGSSELAKLREQLQLLTKASNPLGKFLEAIHDDVETMARELEMWRMEARNQATSAAEAQRQSFESLREANAEQQMLEGKITDQLQKITIVRAQIQTNDRTIEKLVKMVVNPDGKK